MRSKRLNRINVFAMASGLTFVMLAQIGCFRPESSLENKGEDIRATFVGDTADPWTVSLDQHTESSLQRYGAIVKKYSNRYIWTGAWLWL